MDIILAKIDEHSWITKRPKYKKNIYMTSEAMRLKNAKARAWKNYVSNRSNYCRNVYIRLRNDLRKLTRNLRISYEQRMITSLKYKPKLFGSMPIPD